MTILHYTPSIDEQSGGVGAYLQLLTRELGKMCELHILTHPSEAELRLENCTVHYMPYRWLPWNNCRKEFLTMLDEVRPDVFHTNSCWMPVSALTAIWAKQKGYRVVYTPHGMLEPWCIRRHRWKKLPATWLFQRRGLQVCDVIHATSEMEREHLLQLGWNPNVVVIPNCVQMDRIRMKESWQRTLTLLFLSRVHEKKGVPFLIEAVAVLREELAGYTVKVVGPGEADYVAALKQQAERLGVGEMFQFLGPVFGDQKWQLYREADLFVLPTYSENFGIVIPEALASGTPVITTQGTPWNELETHHCGWWTEIGTEPLVAALRQFAALSDDDLRSMGQLGRALVEAEYTSEAVAGKFIELYEKLSKGYKD